MAPVSAAFFGEDQKVSTDTVIPKYEELRQYSTRKILQETK